MKLSNDKVGRESRYIDGEIADVALGQAARLRASRPRLKLLTFAELKIDT